MNIEQFTASALALKARADAASTNEERTALITAIHRLVKLSAVSFELATKTALFGLVDSLGQTDACRNEIPMLSSAQSSETSRHP